MGWTRRNRIFVGDVHCEGSWNPHGLASSRSPLGSTAWTGVRGEFLVKFPPFFEAFFSWVLQQRG